MLCLNTRHVRVRAVVCVTVIKQAAKSLMADLSHPWQCQARRFNILLLLSRVISLSLAWFCEKTDCRVTLVFSHHFMFSSKWVTVLCSHDGSSQRARAGVAVAYMFFPYMLMYVVREPSVPQRDRDGKLSYPILSKHLSTTADDPRKVPT